MFCASPVTVLDVPVPLYTTYEYGEEAPNELPEPNVELAVYNVPSVGRLEFDVDALTDANSYVPFPDVHDKVAPA